MKCKLILAVQLCCLSLLTKVLEWGRLMSYLEQSTRYIPYDTTLSGRFRYFRPPHVLSSGLGARYVGVMDSLFETYRSLLPSLMDWARETYPKDPADSDLVYKQTIKAKACDSVRGILPAATLSNVGIYASGQAFEALVLRMRAHPLPEARAYAELVLDELKKVIPSFLTRIDRPERGGAWVEYLAERREQTAAAVAQIFDADDAAPVAEVELVDVDPDGEDKVIAAICYPHTSLPEHQVLDKVRLLSAAERRAIVEAYVGTRDNRRHRPGRAFERTSYRFDVLGDYGAFRDLQRHRMLTIEWQPLTPRHGYEVPPPVRAAGVEEAFSDAMERSAAFYDDLALQFPHDASYAVALAYRIRYSMQMNAREAMHLIELRSSPQGHPTYRRVAQAMHAAIERHHPAIAAAMQHVDHGDHDLERLAAERAAEVRRIRVAGQPSDVS